MFEDLYLLCKYLCLVSLHLLFLIIYYYAVNPDAIPLPMMNNVLEIFRSSREELCNFGWNIWLQVGKSSNSKSYFIYFNTSLYNTLNIKGFIFLPLHLNILSLLFFLFFLYFSFMSLSSSPCLSLLWSKKNQQSHSFSF